MTATFAQLDKISQDPAFQGRVKIALFTAAVNVYSEAPTTAGHVARAGYAVRVLNGNYDIRSVCYAVLTNPTIEGEGIPGTTNDSIPDGDIQFQVNAVWNALAGA